MASTQLPPLPPYSDQTTTPDQVTLNYYANLCGVLSERRWEWAAANGLDGWTNNNRLAFVDLVEHQMKLRRTERWRSAAEDARERAR